MGRYLAVGIATSIVMKKKDGWESSEKFNVLENKDDMLKDLNNMIDVSKYECIYGNDYIVLQLKTEHFNDNIHELIKELYPMVNCENCILSNCEKKVKILSNKFNKKDFPLTISNKKRNAENIIYCVQSDYEEKLNYFTSPEYYLFENYEYKKNVKIDLYFINLWQDFDKYDGEDETKMLEIINKMSRLYYKSSLSKNMLFYMLG